MSGIFDDLADLKRWVPYRLVYNAKREKFDKIPHTGRHGLSTAVTTDWMTFSDAWTASEGYGLSGVGIVMTGGIELAGWTLVGLDFDDVDFDSFALPFTSYHEKSPSGTGTRAFVWAPTSWVMDYRDSSDTKYPGCHHVEVYVGTAPRFLTITFDVLNEKPIAQLQGLDLDALGKMMQRADSTSPMMPIVERTVLGEGKPVKFTKAQLNADQLALLDGSKDIDRSAVLHGLLIHMIDNGVETMDILATMLSHDALWAYCLSHRNDNHDKAVDFARSEVERAYNKSKRGMHEKIITYSTSWEKVKGNPVKEAMECPSFPATLYTESYGLVGEIARWIMQASYTPRQEFAYASALVMTACLIGPYCTTGSRQGKLNLYMVLVGGTGTGKNEAIDPMGALLSATDAKDCLADFPASEAALRRQLNSSPNILIRLDELAHKLDAMKDNANGSLMGKAILEMYNGARLPPKAYADERRCLPAVENPFVQILGGTTDKVWDVVRTGHMDDGTLNRFLFVSLPDDPEFSRNLKPSFEVKKEFKDKLNAFWRQGRVCDLIGYAPPGFGRKVEYDNDVEKELIKLDIALWGVQKKKYGALYSRYTQNLMKVATILAVGDGRKVVNMKDYETANAFISWSIATTRSKVGYYIADNTFSRQKKRLIRKLEKSPNVTLRMRDAYKFMSITRREMEELLATMTLSGIVEVTKEDGSLSEFITLIDQSADDEED